MANLKETLIDVISRIKREREESDIRLRRAMETISFLEAEIAKMKARSDAAWNTLLKDPASKKTLPDSSKVQQFHVKTIADIWVSSSAYQRFLGDVEAVWEKDLQQPQAAIVMLNQQLKNNKFSLGERLRSKLLLAAIHFSVAQEMEACSLANAVIAEIESDWRYTHLLGIAFYLRGRTMLKLEHHMNAYWDFCAALHTKDYEKEVKKYFEITENLILMKESGHDLDEEHVSPLSTPRHSRANSGPMLTLEPETIASPI